jgi:SAM-dependent methyltransferase
MAKGAGRFKPASINPLSMIYELPSYCRHNTRALDIGVGNGRHAIYLARHGIQVDAIDASPAAINAVRSYGRRHALPIQAHIHDLRNGDPDFRGYGLVLCTLVLHHLSPSHAISLLENARKQAMFGTVHALAAITRNGDFYREVPPGTWFYPDNIELECAYRNANWEILSNYQERRKMRQERADGTPAENVVSFLIARKISPSSS